MSSALTHIAERGLWLPSNNIMKLKRQQILYAMKQEGSFYGSIKKLFHYAIFSLLALLTET